MVSSSISGMFCFQKYIVQFFGISLCKVHFFGMFCLQKCFICRNIEVFIFAVDALREIASQMGKKDWNFNVNPCDENDPNISNWNTPKIKTRPQYNNSVICNCSYPGEICHVESMYVLDSLSFTYY